MPGVRKPAEQMHLDSRTYAVAAVTEGVAARDFVECR
jgi:hypothetical protein